MEDECLVLACSAEVEVGFEGEFVDVRLLQPLVVAVVVLIIVIVLEGGVGVCDVPARVPVPALLPPSVLILGGDVKRVVLLEVPVEEAVVLDGVGVKVGRGSEGEEDGGGVR